MSILTALAQIGSIFRNKASAKAQSNKTPIKDAAFSVGSPMQKGATYSIDIMVDNPGGIAGAYEWGSGIHRTKGTPGTYTIKPKNASMLAFDWPKVAGEPGFMRLPDGRVLLASVQHPGVDARPYLKPTIMETREEFKKILGQGFKAEILSGVNKIEVIIVK
jgi:hypothetical protein